jgi:hypothetical protein
MITYSYHGSQVRRVLQDAGDHYRAVASSRCIPVRARQRAEMVALHGSDPLRDLGPDVAGVAAIAAPSASTIASAAKHAGESQSAVSRIAEYSVIGKIVGSDEINEHVATPSETPTLSHTSHKRMKARFACDFSKLA